MTFYASYPIQGSGSGGGGTVTSVALADGSSTPIYTISGSPVTTSGTLTFTLATETANKVFAGPTSGGAAQPTFRTLVSADLPAGGNLTDAGTDGITITGGTGAVLGAGTSLSQHVSDATHNGYLSSTDWSTFNSKQSALTLGNLTDAGTDGITVTGGTGAVVGSGTSISQQVADSTHNGYLSSANWTTFNNKGSGSVTSVAASVPSVLAISGSPITTSGTLAITYSGTALPVLNGGTGQTTAAAAYNALSPMTTTGDIEYESGANTASRLAIGSTGNVLTVAGGVPTWAAPATSGTVTSVAMSVPSVLSISGSPITSSGTLAVSYSGTALPVANGGTGLTSGTSGGILGYTASGTLASSAALTVSQLVIGGGAGATPTALAAGTQYQSLTMGASVPGYSAVNLAQSAAVTGTLPFGNGGTGQTAYTDGQLLIGNTATGGLSKSTLTAGSNITITNGNGTISIAASGGGGQSTPAANTTSQWDGNVNMSANNFLEGYATTATSGGTTTLTAASPRIQVFTGSSSQTVVLPVTSTLALGFRFTIYTNGTSGTVSVQTSGLTTIATLNMGANNPGLVETSFICILTSGTGPSSWLVVRPLQNYTDNGASGALTVPIFDGTTGQLIQSSGKTITSTPGTNIASWDSNSQFLAVDFISRLTSIATAGGTTTLVDGSQYFQVFTGSSNQTIVMPVASSLQSTYGHPYCIINASTGVLTVNSSGSNLIQTMQPNTRLDIVNILTSGTTAASWSANYSRIKGAAQTQISRLRSAATSLTTATTVNVCTTTTKLTLPAGDWMIYGTVGFSAAATTTVTSMIGAISKTSATLPATDTYGLPTAGEYTVVETFPGLALNGDFTLPLQGVPVSLTASTDYYLVAQGNFGVSTLSVYGSMYALAV